MNKFLTLLKKALSASTPAERDAALAAMELPDDAPVDKSDTKPEPSPELAALTKRLDDLAVENAVLKMGADEQAHYTGLSDADKGAFRGMTPEQRKAKIDAKKALEGDKVDKASVAALVAAEISKAMAPITAENAALKAANEALAKSVGTMTAATEMTELVALAKDAGAPDPEKMAGILKALDKDARAVLVATLKAQAAQIEAGNLFSENGVSIARKGSALDEVQTKAAELRKTEKGLSMSQAIAKVCKDDPALYTRYHAEQN